MPPNARLAILTVAKDLAQEMTQFSSGRLERAAAGFFLSLWRQDQQHRLVIAHVERLPSFEEMQAISQAIGAPDDCDPARTVCFQTSQDGVHKRLPAYVIAWREV